SVAPALRAPARRRRRLRRGDDRRPAPRPPRRHGPWMSAADGWTIPMAVAKFAEQGMPVDEARFRIAVTRVARIPRAGEMPSGRKGGRGQTVYEIAQLQRLHAALSPWLTAPGGSHEE